jgi:hypothetical protein
MAGGGMGGAGMAGGGIGGVPTCDPVRPPKVFIGDLSGTQEVPSNVSLGFGLAVAELNAAETELTVSVYWEGLTSNTIGAHIHGPAAPGVNADIVYNLTPTGGSNAGSVVARTFQPTAAELTALKNGQYYANVHSTMFMMGELRAQLVPATLFRSGPLAGDQEVPSNESTGTGHAVVVYSPGMLEGAVSVTWSGMSGNTTAGWVHVGVHRGFTIGPVFDVEPPLGAPSGSVTHRRWAWNFGDAENMLFDRAYANIRSSTYPNGELRGQLLPPCP